MENDSAVMTLCHKWKSPCANIIRKNLIQYKVEFILRPFTKNSSENWLDIIHVYIHTWKYEKKNILLWVFNDRQKINRGSTFFTADYLERKKEIDAYTWKHIDMSQERNYLHSYLPVVFSTSISLDAFASSSSSSCLHCRYERTCSLFLFYVCHI